MQVCFECDKWFSDDKDHPAICPECTEKSKDDKEQPFLDYLFDRIERNNEFV